MNHPFEQKVKDAIDSHRLIDLNSGRTVICTLSGGADSTALLCALTRLGVNCTAAHCNFHLRGDESMRDQTHAQTVASELNVPILIKDMDVTAYRQSNKASIEMACRDLRYEWFHELKKNLNAQAIAVAHNLSDNIETMLLNLMRGTGIDGLRAMKWRTDSGVIRPMLGIKRNEIEQYLEDIDIKFVTDSSNLTDNFMRNKVRHHILPAIEKTAPQGFNGVTQTIEHLASQSELYHSLISETMARCSDADGGIDLNRIARLDHGALLLFEWLKPHGISKQQATDAISSRNVSGSTFTTSSSIFINDHGVLRMCTTASMTNEAFPFVISRHHVSEFNPERNPAVAYFDASVLDSPLPLTMRHWQHGDTLAPFGMKGSRKLSDIFSDAKLSLAQKQQVPLLMLGDTILWVGGIRGSRHFPVTADTKYFIKVSLK